MIKSLTVNWMYRVSGGSLTGHLQTFSARWSVKELMDSKLHIFQEMDCLVIVSSNYIPADSSNSDWRLVSPQAKRSGFQNLSFLLWGVFYKVQIQPGTRGSHCNGWICTLNKTPHNKNGKFWKPDLSSPWDMSLQSLLLLSAGILLHWLLLDSPFLEKCAILSPSTLSLTTVQRKGASTQLVILQTHGASS